MKTLVNTTVLVYLSQTTPELIQKLGLSTISDVSVELEHLFGEAEARQLLAGVEVKKVMKVNFSDKYGKWLSTTDVRLLHAAMADGMLLISDDKKVLATAKQNGISCKDTPHFIESLGNKIDKQEALELIDRLAPIYLRRKIIRQVRERIARW